MGCFAFCFTLFTNFTTGSFAAKSRLCVKFSSESVCLFFGWNKASCWSFVEVLIEEGVFLKYVSNFIVVDLHEVSNFIRTNTYFHLLSLLLLLLLLFVQLIFFRTETNNDLINHGKFCFPKDFRGGKNRLFSPPSW